MAVKFSIEPDFVIEEEPFFDTLVSEGIGMEQRRSKRVDVLRKWRLIFKDRHQSEIDIVRSFFSSRLGAYDYFEWDNINDSTTYYVRYELDSFKVSLKQFDVYDFEITFIGIFHWSTTSSTSTTSTSTTTTSTSTTSTSTTTTSTSTTSTSTSSTSTSSTSTSTTSTSTTTISTTSTSTSTTSTSTTTTTISTSTTSTTSTISTTSTTSSTSTSTSSSTSTSTTTTTIAWGPLQCLAQYKMNDNASTTVVIDSSGNSRNGVSQRYTKLMYYVNGKINSALNFNGISDYIQITDEYDLSTLNEFSVTGWVYADNLTVGHNQIIFSQTQSNGNSNVFIYISSGTGRLVFGVKNSNGVNVEIESNISIIESTWYFFIAWWDGATIKLFINNVEQTNSVSLVALNTIGSSYWSIGVSNIVGTDFFDGVLDNLCVFQEALNSSERGSLYHGGLGTEDLHGNNTTSTSTSTTSTSTSTTTTSTSTSSTSTSTTTTLDWFGVSSVNLDSRCGEHGSAPLSAALNGTNFWYHDVNEIHWFIIDLSSTRYITKVRGRSESEIDPTDVDVYISDSKADWGTAVHTNITTWQNINTWVEITLDTAKSGRYIKIVINSTEGVSGEIGFGGDITPFTIFDVYSS